jgi:hypothetical protein
MAIVYCTHNTLNSKKYIGKDSKNNPHYLGSGVNIKQAIKKYGKENFEKEILWEGPIEYMNDMETYWLEYFNVDANPLFYNATKHNHGLTHYTDELREKRSEHFKNWWQNTTYKKIGKPLSEECKQKKSKTMKVLFKGKPSPMDGKTHSDETKQKMSKSQKGRKYSEESKKRMSEARKKYLATRGF